jgi:glycosyltransferase involved in cell wall biosynthesis
MDVVVSLEHRYLRTPDGGLWTASNHDYEFFRRYLLEFGSVKVLARVKSVSRHEPSWKRADGPGVSFHGIPHYVGPWQYLASAWRVRRSIGAGLVGRVAIIARVPSLIGDLLRREAVERRLPFAVEVIGDPFDVFSPGGVKHPLRWFFRWSEPRRLRRACRAAVCAAYVTAGSLQKRYPTYRREFAFSDVELPEEAFAKAPRVFPAECSHASHGSAEEGCAWRLVVVGQMCQMHKGHDVLLGALAICARRGLNFQLTLVGDGPYRHELEDLAARLKLSGQCHFVGELPGGSAVGRALDLADVFVLPSRAEGMPRALLEAMARGLPCIASDVGGVSEVLDRCDLVPPGDACALAEKLCSVLAMPVLLRAMSERNRARARDFAEANLEGLRRAFYRELRDTAERWFDAQGNGCYEEGRVEYFLPARPPVSRS